MRQDWNIFEENNYRPSFTLKIVDAVLAFAFALFLVAVLIKLNII